MNNMTPTNVAMPNTVNGLNVGALAAFAQEVSNNPRKGMATFRVCTKWTGATRSSTNVSEWNLGGQRMQRHFSIASDEPTQLLGSESAPNPQEILMAATNACMMVGFVAVSALKGITLESVEIEMAGELDLRGFLGLDPAIEPGYREVAYVVRIKGDGTQQQFEEIHKTVMATSPNYYNLSQPVRMVSELIVHSSSKQ